MSSDTSEWEGRLTALGHTVRHFEDLWSLYDAFATETPRALLLSVGDDAESLHSDIFLLLNQASRLSVPVIALTLSEKSAKVSVLNRFNDWVTAASLPELDLRIEQVVRRFGLGMNLSAGAKFLSVLVHDIRTPLNVMRLSYHLIEQSLLQGTREFEEDIGCIRDSVLQVERMLALVGDYSTLLESKTPTGYEEVELSHFLNDVLDDSTWQSIGAVTNKQLRIDPGCPAMVWLDPQQTRVALIHAMSNAAIAAAGAAITLTAKTEADRLVLAIEVDRPPPSHIHSIDLYPAQFERLRGNASERRGFDLALCSRVCELLDGHARLEVNPGHGTTILLNFPLSPSQVRSSTVSSANGR